MKPLSLYIHIPFCIAKCGYCDFNSYALDTLLEKGHASEDWAPRYADALMEEIEKPGRGVFFRRPEGRHDIFRRGHALAVPCRRNKARSRPRHRVVRPEA